MKKGLIIGICAVLAVVIAACAFVLPGLNKADTQDEGEAPAGMVKVWLLESCQTKSGEGGVISYSDDGIPTEYLTYNSNNEVAARVTYDEKGRSVCTISYLNGMDASETSVEYDENGNVLRSVTVYGGQTLSDLRYTYNENGDLAKLEGTQNGAETVYEYQYGAKGMPLVVTESTITGEKSRQEYEYEDDGTLLLKTVYQNGAVAYTIEYEYGENGESYVEKKVSADGSYREIRGHRYDENGRKVEFRLDGSNGENTYLFTYLEDGRLDKVVSNDGETEKVCKYKAVTVTAEKAEELQKIQDSLFEGILYDAKLQ